MSAYTDVMKKAWTDQDFRQALTANPKATLERELGQSIPNDVEIYIHEQNPKSLHLIVPPAQLSDGELSETELEQVAGGAFTLLWTAVCWT